MITLYKQGILQTLNIMCSGKQYTLDNIIFFNEKGIITQTGRGCFDDNTEKTFEGTICRKMKIDFKMKDNFIVKSSEKSYFETKYDLYVYEKNADIQYLGKKQRFFGEIYEYWKVNESEIVRFSQSLTKNLNEYNRRAKEITDKLGNIYSYMGQGMENEEFRTLIQKLRELNNEIIDEVVKIKNYKIDE